MALQQGDLVLCTGTLQRAIAFEHRLTAAVAGGFAGISLWGRDYLDARAEGHSDHDIRSMLHDYGIEVAELDPAWSWLPGTEDIQIPPDVDEDKIFQFLEADLFAIAEAVGARSINAVDIFSGSWDLEEATTSFAALCRRAAEHGLLVHLEFLPWSKIPDIETAWNVVRDADEPNGGIGLDSWHYFRGSPDDELLRSIPGDRILGVQLSDAPAAAETNLVEATLRHRLLPGDGELALTELVAALEATGVQSPIGVEVFSDALHALPPVEAARLAGDAARRILGRA